MKISEVTYSQLEARLDANYYQHLYLNTERMLHNIGPVPLESIAGFSKLRYDPTKKPELEFNYIDISNVDIQSGEVFPQKIKGYAAPSRARKLVRTNDILISTVRPNRNAVTIIDEELNNSICSTGFSVISTTDLNPYFLFIYLKTKYTVNQLVRLTMASMYPAVSEKDVSTILIPIPPKTFQKRIEDLARDAYAKIRFTREKRSKLDPVLIQKLGIGSLPVSDEKNYETTFLAIQNGHRFDAEYYHPKYSLLIKQVEKQPNVRFIGEISESIRHLKEFKREFAETGIGYLRVQNVISGYIDDTDIVFIPENAVKQLHIPKLQKDEVLVTRSGTLGMAAHVSEAFEGFCASADFLKIKLKSEIDGTKIDPIYVTIFLNSVLGALQLEQSSIGAVQRHTTTDALAQVMIPIPSERIQSDIARLVVEIEQLKTDARNKINQAKKEVEDFIENNAGTKLEQN